MINKYVYLGFMSLHFTAKKDPVASKRSYPSQEINILRKSCT